MLPFTPRFRTAIAHAETRHPHQVSCLDLLAGIISVGSGVAVGLLKSRGFAASDLISTSSGEPIGDPRDPNPVQYELCALTALSRGIDEAVSLSHGLVGIEHMLAGILVSECPEVARAFAERNVSVDETLSELRKNM